eukprot:jgi/Astpho2/9812/Aster-x0411
MSSMSSELPNFIASTKFFACLDLSESQELLEQAHVITVQPNETLFEDIYTVLLQCGDDSSPGIFIVLEGRLGVYLPDNEQLLHTNTLMPGESIGDLDVLDGARRASTCIAMSDGAQLVQISQELFVTFTSARPRVLQIYLQKAIAVHNLSLSMLPAAHFVVSCFKELQLLQTVSRV